MHTSACTLVARGPRNGIGQDASCEGAGGHQAGVVGSAIGCDSTGGTRSTVAELWSSKYVPVTGWGSAYVVVTRVFALEGIGANIIRTDTVVIAVTR